jgi:general nucleoside transport system ATP-binding protein
LKTNEAARGLAAIEARGLHKAFDGRPANDDVNFRAFAGEIHAVLGENGAGKSTLISILSGIYRPDAGEMLIAGERVGFRSPHDALEKGIGVVHQELKLIDNLSVLENVVLGTGQRPTKEAKERVRTLARRAGFDVNPDWPVHILSISQRQQVEILKLLFRDLKIMIFDEPTAVLGEGQVLELFGILEALKRQRKTIILITHRLREVRAIADRLTILRRGRVVVEDRSPGEFTDTQLAELMVGAEARSGEQSVHASAVPLGATVVAFRDVHLPSLSGSGLRGVSFELRGGELLGVAGVRGNGQRELAELAAGIEAPAAGHIERTTQEVGFIPEDRLGAGLARRLTIADNLALRCYRERAFGRPMYKNFRALRGHAERLIDQYEIPSRHNSVVTQLSGGGLQRVVVARELARQLPLVVAAQPTRGLDLRAAGFVRQHLVTAARSGAGVLLISEDLDELMELADRILVLYEGRVMANVERPSFSRQFLGALIIGGKETRTDHGTLAG